MPTSNKEVVTKLDAAQRQLDTALKLWFDEGDLVSIFSLAASAHQIIHDLNSKDGGDELIFDSLVIKDEYRRDYIRHIKKPWNFIKHSDQEDSMASLELSVSVVVNFLIFSVKGLSQLGRPISGYRAIFLLWFGVRFSSYLRSREEFRAKFKIDERQEALLRELPLKEFISHSLPIFPTNTPSEP